MHTLSIKIFGENIAKSPYEVYVDDALDLNELLQENGWQVEEDVEDAEEGEGSGGEEGDEEKLESEEKQESEDVVADEAKKNVNLSSEGNEEGEGHSKEVRPRRESKIREVGGSLEVKPGDRKHRKRSKSSLSRSQKGDEKTKSEEKKKKRSRSRIERSGGKKSGSRRSPRRVRMGGDDQPAAKQKVNNNRNLKDSPWQQRFSDRIL